MEKLKLTVICPGSQRKPGSNSGVLTSSLHIFTPHKSRHSNTVNQEFQNQTRDLHTFLGGKYPPCTQAHYSGKGPSSDGHHDHQLQPPCRLHGGYSSVDTELQHLRSLPPAPLSVIHLPTTKDNHCTALKHNRFILIYFWTLYTYPSYHMCEVMFASPAQHCTCEISPCWQV